MAGAVAAGNPNANFGESLLALFIVLVFAIVGGFMVKMIRGIRLPKWMPGKLSLKKIQGCCNFGMCKKIVIPPLIGEIVMGAIARNFLPGEVMDKYDDQWASYIRMMCLGIILLRGGMELEFEGKGLGVTLLTTIPPLTEGIMVALCANWWLGMSMSLSLCLGAVMGAVSPAVLVPCLMNLQMRGYGILKGIPLTLLAASSFNDVFNITLFSVTSTIAFNNAGVSDKSIGEVLLIILLEIIGGVGVGIILGLTMKFFTSFGHTFKAALTLFVCAFFVVLSEILKVPEAKYVGIITYGYICYRWWGVAGKPEHLLAQIWTLFTPFLFGTIGAALKFDEIDGAVILPGIAIVLVGSLFRSLATMSSMLIPCKYNVKELGFMAIAWLPKATVQAAIGGVILDFAKNEKIDEYLKAGNEILTIAVISVVLCAPMGAILTVTFGQKWLSKDVIKTKKKATVKKFSKWDIVYIYVTDYYQRVSEAKSQGKPADSVQFVLSAQEKEKRMQDRNKFLYQLKLYRQQNDDAKGNIEEEIELHRLEIKQEFGANMEFASAFSSLASSKENTQVAKIKKINEQRNLEDIEIQKRKNSDGGQTKENQSKDEVVAAVDGQSDKQKPVEQQNIKEIQQNVIQKMKSDIIYQDQSMEYHDDFMVNVDEEQNKKNVETQQQQINTQQQLMVSQTDRKQKQQPKFLADKK